MHRAHIQAQYNKAPWLSFFELPLEELLALQQLSYEPMATCFLIIMLKLDTEKISSKTFSNKTKTFLFNFY